MDIFYGWRMETRFNRPVFYSSCRKKKYASRLFIVARNFFLRFEYFMMGWKHSKERRQFHFDCCTGADIALWQRDIVTEIEQKSSEETVLRFFKFSPYARQTRLILSSKFAKLQFKRHAKITRRVNIEWDDAKIGEKKKKNKRKDFIRRVLTKNSILCEIGARL